jgi:hypothetical protein
LRCFFFSISSSSNNISLSCTLLWWLHLSQLDLFQISLIFILIFLISIFNYLIKKSSHSWVFNLLLPS